MADDVRRVVRAWSDAVDRHDLTSLDRMYDDSVAYAGSWAAKIPKERVLAAKQVQLGSASRFRQTIVDPIEVFSGPIVAARKAVFRLSVSDGGAAHEVVETIGVEKSFVRGRFVITEETDEAAARARVAWRTACEGASAAAVHALDEVKAFDARAATETTPDAADESKPVLFTGPAEDLDGERFRVTIGYGTSTQLLPKPRVEYSVARKTGRVDVTVVEPSGETKALAVPAEGQAAIARACKGPVK